jgi:eukaryotic translation initiation factor 2C
MGVSYASPAYYADRLCERARCYLREFFSPTQATRNWFTDHRREIERDKGLPKLMQIYEKTDKDRFTIKAKKEEVEKEMQSYTWDQAHYRLHAKDDKGRELPEFNKKIHEALKETMYWI